MGKNKFSKVDLHIHTPASLDCYEKKYDDSEEEYLGIINQAKKLDLKVVAFTDHNSIEGYKKLLDIIRRLKLLKEKYSSNTESENENKLKEIDKKLNLFKNILVLPGVEFQTKECCHILVIFDNRTPIKVIENFLFEGGYNVKSFGRKDNTKKLSNWDVLELLEKTKEYNCIVIAPHIDSDKGIYKLNKSYRASCFKSEQLMGVSYNSEVTKDKIKNIIETSIDYKREKVLVFIKDSDAHSINNIGKSFTYFELKELDFDSLKNSFNNPSEISIIIPETKVILEKVINEKNSFGILDFSEDNQDYFLKLICALNNTESGRCFLGLTDRKSIIGLPKNDKTSINSYFKIILNLFRKIEGKFHYSINYYEIKKDSIVISFKIFNRDNLISIKDENKIYFIKENEVKAANAEEIQRFIEEKQFNYLKDIIEIKVNNIESECNIVRVSLESLPLLKKIEKRIRLLSNIISRPKLIFDKDFNRSEILRINEKINSEENGTNNGNIMFLTNEIPIRYEHSFLRISIPTVRCKINHNKVKKETIILVPGGGIFFNDSCPLLFSEKKYWALVFNSNLKNYNNKFIVAYLKSSFFIWYCLNKFETIDIIDKSIFSEIEIPMLKESENTKQIVNKIIDLTDEIIKKEMEFLKVLKKDVKLSIENKIEIIDNHNSSVEPLFIEIDDNIYKLLNLNVADIEIIKSYLKAEKYYPYYINYKENQNNLLNNT